MNAVRVTLRTITETAVTHSAQVHAPMVVVSVRTFVNVRKDSADRRVMFVSFHDCMLSSTANIAHTLIKYTLLFFEACPPNRYGKKCKSKCNCANGASCDPYDGKCICRKGYQGRRCDEICPPDHYGENCQETCQCKNSGTCHHITGLCHCPPGFNGPL
jgi:hypothetical protein